MRSSLPATCTETHISRSQWVSLIKRCLPHSSVLQGLGAWTLLGPIRAQGGCLAGLYLPLLNLLGGNPGRIQVHPTLPATGGHQSATVPRVCLLPVCVKSPTHTLWLPSPVLSVKAPTAKQSQSSRSVRFLITACCFLRATLLVPSSLDTHE